MGRGPTITPEEIKRAHELKAQGVEPKIIAERMGRSLQTIFKMLASAVPQ